MLPKHDEPLLKPMVETALISEIALQAKLAQMAWESLSSAVSSVEYWAAIQGILSASANISKILWPVSKKRKARGIRLRELLCIDKNHFLADRSIRNSFEHYDERIEDWFEKNDTATYCDLALEAKAPGLLMPPTFSHRYYDQYTHELKFRDQKINLRELLSELALLKEKCRYFVLILD